MQVVVTAVQPLSGGKALVAGYSYKSKGGSSKIEYMFTVDLPDRRTIKTVKVFTLHSQRLFELIGNSYYSTASVSSVHLYSDRYTIQLVIALQLCSCCSTCTYTLTCRCSC